MKEKILIGEKLKELRKAKGLSLVELAKLSGIQIATLSRIEHNKMTGTLNTHALLAKAFGLELSEFYKIAISSIPTNDKEEPEIIEQDDAVSHQILAKNVSFKKMLPTLLIIKPQRSTKKEKVQSEQFLYVIEGHVEILIDKETYKANKGHSLYIKPELTISFNNVGKGEAKIIAVKSNG